MGGYRNILFPLNDCDEALDQAINIAKQSNAKLYLLHTYRFDVEKSLLDENSDRSLKHALDERHWQTLQRKYSSKLDQSGVNYEFMVEVGFLADRILFNFREHDIDMVFLADSDKYDEPIKEKLQDLNIPLTIV